MSGVEHETCERCGCLIGDAQLHQDFHDQQDRLDAQRVKVIDAASDLLRELRRERERG